MTDREQTKAFGDDLDALVERYRKEFDLSLAQAVGVLQVKIHGLIDDVRNKDDDED